MSQTQKANIIKTVIIIVAIMVTILLLFLNKITTPRYLSNIELKINKLELIKTPLVVAEPAEQWRLLYVTSEQEQILNQLFPEMRKHIQSETQLIPSGQLSKAVAAIPYDLQVNIGVINKSGELMGYLKPPFDQHKMLLTYSSVFTHR